MPGIGVVFDGVAGFLTLVIHLVLFDVTVIDVLCGHPEGLGEGNQEMKKIHHLHPSVLLVDLLVFGPPFPRKAVDQFGNFLRHRARVVEGPLGFFVWGEVSKIDPDLFVEEVLHAEDFVEFVGLGHARFVAVGMGTRRPFCREGVRPCEQYRDWETDRKSTRLNSSHSRASRMPSSA